eukprot:SAG22_NODE_2926_length_2100_cov_1.423288_1_plen_569_part_00
MGMKPSPPLLLLLLLLAAVASMARTAGATPCAEALTGAESLEAFTAEINTLCCNGGGQHRRRLQAGADECVLGSCPRACAELLVLYFEECPERMHELVGHAAGISRFRQTCAEVLFDSSASCTAARNSWGKPAITDAQRDQATLATFSPRVRDLLAGMSREQKVGQMVQLNVDEAFSNGGHDDAHPNGFKASEDFARDPASMVDEDLVRSYTGHPHYVGSWLNSPFSDDTIRHGRSFLNASAFRAGALRCADPYLRTLQPAGPIYSIHPLPNGTVTCLLVAWPRPAVIRKLQTVTMEDGGPPMVFGLDSVHGAIYVGGATVFPHQINCAASFNTAATQQMGRITAKDTKAAGIPWIFAPILGIATQPAWSRVMETFGEDPHLASEMGAAIITGMQGGADGVAGGDLASPQAAAACAKHYIGYSNSENGHDRAPTVIPDRILQQYFRPSFQAAFDAGCATAMNAYTDINGEPMASSRKYLQEYIRDEMGWNGMLVTDWGEIRNQYDWHRVVATPDDAVKVSMEETSIDMSMVPTTNRNSDGEITSAATSFNTAVRKPQDILAPGIDSLF